MKNKAVRLLIFYSIVQFEILSPDVYVYNFFLFSIDAHFLSSAILQALKILPIPYVVVNAADIDIKFF